MLALFSRWICTNMRLYHSRGRGNPRTYLLASYRQYFLCPVIALLVSGSLFTKKNLLVIIVLHLDRHHQFLLSVVEVLG
ncbi:hypothetical protein LZ31DRAFT_252144 [Colletotrichum somersetense]|nr:hypothetical protein LZ31DRAFT_252144 [Colletotrichum somersetense]